MHNPNRSQSGVALIQVLLICAILLLFVVQLSKESRDQVKTALHFKERALAEVEIQSTLNKVQFALLTRDSSAKSVAIDGAPIPFHGEEVLIDGGLKVSLQDEAGLLSLPYGAEYLKRLPEFNAQQIEQLLLWQGTSHLASGPTNRSGVMPVLNEVNLLPGLENVPVNGLTHFPTKFYALLLSPDALLDRMFKPGVAERIKKVRYADNAYNELQQLTGFDYESLGNFSNSNMIQVRVETVKKPYLSRGERFEINPFYASPIQALGL